MRSLAVIEALYLEFATELDARLDRANQSGDATAILRIEEKQRVNDSAYFILAWGQIEAEINRMAEQAVRRHRSSTVWTERRAWDAHDPDTMRARFEDRVALVLDRANTESDAYRRTIRYYGWRNGIAHGTTLATGIDVAAIIGDFYQIDSELTG